MIRGMKKSQTRKFPAADVLFAFDMGSDKNEERSDSVKAKSTPPLVSRSKSPSEGLGRKAPKSSNSRRIYDSDSSSEIDSDTWDNIVEVKSRPLGKRARVSTSSTSSSHLSGCTPKSNGSGHDSRRRVLNSSMEKLPPTSATPGNSNASLPPSESQSSILQTLTEISGLLQNLGQRMENTEKEVKSIKAKLSGPTATDCSVKNGVPLYVKVSDSV